MVVLLLVEVWPPFVVMFDVEEVYIFVSFNGESIAISVEIANELYPYVFWILPKPNIRRCASFSFSSAVAEVSILKRLDIVFKREPGLNLLL